MTLPLEREALVPRIDGVRKNLKRLRELGKLSFDEFRSGDAFIHDHLGDVEEFLRAVGDLVENPGKLGLTIQ